MEFFGQQQQQPRPNSKEHIKLKRYVSTPNIPYKRYITSKTARLFINEQYYQAIVNQAQ